MEVVFSCLKEVKMSILWLIFVFYLILLKVNCHVGASKNGVLYYTNEWAVHTFSRDLAEDIANKEGFHITQVCLFLFCKMTRIFESTLILLKL